MNIDDFLEGADSGQTKQAMPDSSLTSDHTTEALNKKMETQAAPAPKADHHFSFKSMFSKSAPVKETPATNVSPEKQFALDVRAFEKALKAKQVDEAVKLFTSIKHRSDLLLNLPDTQRKPLYDAITKLDKILVDELVDYEKHAAHVLEQINTTVADAQKLDYAAGLKKYRDAQKLMDKIPVSLAEYRNEAQAYVLHLFIQLLQKKSKLDHSTVHKVHSEVLDVVNNAHQYIARGNFDKAEELYRSAVGLIKTMPAGFVKEKTMLYKTIMSLHTEISYGKKMHFLQSMIKTEVPARQQARPATPAKVPDSPPRPPVAPKTPTRVPQARAQMNRASNMHSLLHSKPHNDPELQRIQQLKQRLAQPSVPKVRK